jgi:hypothetical protein
VGGVSTGKSTFLNGAFCEKLTQCKIKRTTMIPTCYIENDKATDSIEYIYKTISEKNKCIIEKTEKGLTGLSPEDYAELLFNVGKLDINFIGSNGYIEMYDIPGLNDARTKSYYYRYLEENFYKFNVVIMFVDINSGLNTSDEMDMLNFIITHTQYHKGKGRDIYTLIVVNKADDMTLEDGNLVINGELHEMFEQVQQTAKTSFKEKGIEKHLIGITPFCAMDAYLYRMIQKYPEYELSDEERIKIGINEMGKKFNKFGKARQIEEVKEILKKESFISDMISLSGFKQIEDMIYKFLKKNRKGFEIENVLYIIRSMRPISDAFIDKEIYSDTISKAVAEYVSVYEQLKAIDETQYDSYMKELLNAIINEVNEILVNHISQFGYKTLITHNNLLMEFIIYKYFTPYYDKTFDENEYKCINQRIIVHTFSQICNRFRLGGCITIQEIIDVFVTIKYIKKFNKVYTESILDNIMSNQRENGTITDFNGIFELIELCDQIKEKGVDIMPFLRFVILNKIKYNHYGDKDADELFILHMMYQNNLCELPITNVIGMIRQNITTPPNIKLILKGFVKEYTEYPRFMLDAYYLSLC